MNSSMQTKGACYPAFSIRAEARNLRLSRRRLISEALDHLEVRIIFHVVKLVNDDPFFLCVKT